MKERILLLIKAKNLTAAQFADEIGVQKSGISHIISGRNNPSLDFVQKILLRFPEVNMEWLIMDKGPMFSGDSARQTPPGTTLFPLHADNIHEPDLFSPEISPAFEPKTDKTLNESGVNSAVEEIEKPEKEKKIESEISEFNAKFPAKVHEPTAGNSKMIEKVLFFYSDKTFLEYNPEY